MRIRAAILALAVAACGCGDKPSEIDVLVFSRTTAYRHADAIEAGRAALGERFGADLTEDPERFSDDGLRDVDVVVLLQTNGTGVLRGGQRAAFERWVRAGGGVVAIHAAANADRDWAFYGELLGGARFESHRPGPLQRETVVIEPHPATEGLPRRWTRSDEWYRFDPEPTADVLATVDGDPMAWWTAIDRGRSFYTALGHAGAAWSEPLYREHVFAAVEWAGGAGRSRRAGSNFGHRGRRDQGPRRSSGRFVGLEATSDHSAAEWCVCSRWGNEVTTRPAEGSIPLPRCPKFGPWCGGVRSLSRSACGWIIDYL